MYSVLGLATAYLLNVLIVSEYYPASDEQKSDGAR